ARARKPGTAAPTTQAAKPEPASVTPPASAAPPAQARATEQPRPAPVSRDRTEATVPVPQAPAESTTTKLRGAAARVVANMQSSLNVPTATSVRAVPAKLIADNRIVINNHLKRSRGGKVSFTHVIGYALVKALESFPEMNTAFADVDGKPALITPEHVNLGLAIDLHKDDGSRQLVVASIKGCDGMDFVSFWLAYEEIIKRARQGNLTTDDFAGTTISLTNPGTLGTNHSVPRLMAGQGAILGVGAMEYPAEFQGMSEEMLAEIALSKTITLTSTYDHRIIQGAQSGDFLRRMHQLLLGEDGFYDEVFRSLRIPYEPVRWVTDVTVRHEGQIDKNARVIELIDAYRTNGHLMADTDPLEFKVRTHPDLDIIQHGLTLWDLDRVFPVGGFAGEATMSLRDILGVLRNSYCRTVGIEYKHITDPEERGWLQKRIEIKHDVADVREQKHVLGRLNAAEAFETFLQTKYVGQKRFSLEGAESVIPLLDAVLQKAAEYALDEVAIGMPHRGRLNVLANVMGKSYAKIFSEFEGNMDTGTVQGSGDVKYHLGASGTFTHPDRNSAVRVSLTSNPSHLEAVNPVLEGIVRAKQDLINKGEGGFTVMPVLMHGDSAFAGQGVVAETLNLSSLRGYRVGGTIHLVVNNQVGFTTSAQDARSSVYATDVAKMVQAPIFHVNGDDPEACVRVARLAFEFRQAFHKDVVIDMVCYRLHGHNEGDDPSYTQPLMYKQIERRRSVRKLYTEALVRRGDITLAEAEKALDDFVARMQTAFEETRTSTPPDPTGPRTRAPADAPADVPANPRTGVERAVLDRVVGALHQPPEGFTVHPKLARQMETRRQLWESGQADWALAEALAFGSLLTEGTDIRLSGQDSRWGTFSQRHSVLVDYETGREWSPLSALGGPGKLWVYDSMLSEYAALGFEYGYSIIQTEALVMWEAQFGDFVNGAQI
ncbi:MAG: multifunctional oxoglutarate decarboxylase/oxoglutarate dehydrogenase thiamine pyrophosphate-binding subunit/dihydrolipoyllysine-residue succinyltransferase subunit, partial [Actinomycetota bacterium]|nr:multifunctional oxoglutarate decarboxylase/oxoglutarate dehydrogenase thiamine pyrophosphate-binding subunit/dihydrolipoyllysine-residue succinyltransferase subunit [Actinomycetota bacterium]